MSRFTGPRVKILRRLGGVDLPGLTRKMRWVQNRPFPPGQHGRNLRIKKSDYRIRLEGKQKVRFYYGIRERQLVNYMRRAAKAKGNTGELLLRYLESRLDNTIFRMGLAPTLPAARQMVNHGHIAVNGKKVNIASYEVHPGNEIAVRDRERSRKLGEIWSAEPSLSVPPYLEFDKKALKGRVIDWPGREYLPYELAEHFIIEYYSQKI